MAYDYGLPSEDDVLHRAQLWAGYPISRRDFDALSSIYSTALPLSGKVVESNEQP